MLSLFDFTCRGKNWNDNDEVYSIISDTPENALTKLRILHGEDVYRRCYMVFDCDRQECVRELFSYGVFRERMQRDVGKKYFYYNGSKITAGC